MQSVPRCYKQNKLLSWLVAALRQDRNISLRPPVQQHLPREEIQRIDLSVQAPSSTNDTSKIATLVQHIMTELTEAVSENGKISHYKNGN
jgi:hypothetical protein